MEKASACAIDTLTIFKRLKDADLNEKAAGEIASVIKDVVESNLISRKDLEQVQTDLKLAISKVEADLKLAISEIDLKIEQTRSNLELKIERVKSDTVRWIAGLLIAQAAVIVSLIKLL